jgi:hypothetical protein
MSIWRLLVYKLKIFLAEFSRGKKRRRYVRIASTAVLIAVIAGFSFGAYAIFSALGAYGEEGRAVAGLIVVMGFHALLVVGLVFDIAATTNIFFLSSDLNLLMASPLPALRVFVLKYVESLASASVITIMVGIPMLVGYGAALSARPSFYPACVVVLALFMSIPVSIGTLSGLVICRYVPASKVKEILGVVSGLFAFGIWLAIQLVRPRLEQPEYFTDFEARIRALASYGEHAVLRLLPSHMAALSLTRIASGNPAAAVAPFLWLAATAGVMVVISIVLAQRMYLAGWTRVVPGGGKTGRTRRKVRLRWIVGWLPPVERSIVATTMHLLIRDPQQVMPIAMITVMMAALPLLMGRSQAGVVLSPRLIVQSLAALTFVGSLHLATNASAIDGRSFWIILAAPCSTVRKLISKLMVPLLFFIPLALVIAFLLRGAGIVRWPFALRLIWISACTTSVGGSAGILLGVTYADWDWEMPRRMLRTTGRLVMIGTMALFFVVVAALAQASTLGRNLGTSGETGWIMLAAVSAGAGAVTAILLRTAAKKLRTMEWTL